MELVIGLLGIAIIVGVAVKFINVRLDKITALQVQALDLLYFEREKYKEFRQIRLKYVQNFPNYYQNDSLLSKLRMLSRSLKYFDYGTFKYAGQYKELSDAFGNVTNYIFKLVDHQDYKEIDYYDLEQISNMLSDCDDELVSFMIKHENKAKKLMNDLH